MRNKILIYCDKGSGDITNLRKSLTAHFAPLGIRVELTDADKIIKHNALDESVLAFFMPGGQATPYLEKLKVQGNGKIAAYVAAGGTYFGICAGAYYAGRKVIFEPDVKTKAITQRCGLSLIGAETIGSLYKELNLNSYSRDFSSLSAVEVRWLADGEKHTTTYHGGPYFKPLQKDKVEVLAEYVIEKKTMPAVVMQRYGKGKAIATGVHIEDSGEDFYRILPLLNEGKEQAEKLIFHLTQNEPSRQALFAKLMDKITR